MEQKKDGRLHDGIDIASAEGPYVIGVRNGTVTDIRDGCSNNGYYGNPEGYGNYVIVDYGDGFEVLYGHLYPGSLKVKVGDSVTYGQVIANMGNSGSSTGTHLHFRMHLNGESVDPLDYISMEDPRPMTKVFYSDGASSSGFEQLVRWNAYMEHGIDLATYTGDYFEFLSDGFGGVAILGLDTRWYSDHFIKLGYSTSVGSKVPRDVVESYYREVIQGMYDEVKAQVVSGGCNMTEYQLYALTARRYNWGQIGSSTVDAYKRYWNQSRDDKLSQRIKHGDYSHSLYSQCMWYPDNGGVLTGRRKEEWDLFQCGYFSLIDEWYTEDSYISGDSGDILAVAEEMHTYFEKHGYSYDGAYAQTFEGSKQYRAAVCATYVSWVLQKCGYIKDSEHYDDCGTEQDIFRQYKWTEIKVSDGSTNQLRPGDIVIYCYGATRWHTDIYVGNGKKLNAGSDYALSGTHYQSFSLSGSQGTYSHYFIYRPPNSGKSTTSSSQFATLLKKGRLYRKPNKF